MKQPRAARLLPPVRPQGGGRTVLGVAGPLAEPVARPRPLLGALGLEIEGPVPMPGEYPPGTAGFRYWATAEALGRVAALWRRAAPAPWSWAHGERLRVHLATDNRPEAVYERGRLLVGGAASPAVAMRALGHAVLDALRPALWNVASAAVARFHADFAEAVALLATLEVPGAEDGLALVRSEAVSPFGVALAEGLALLAGPPARRRDLDVRLLAQRGARLLADAVGRAAVTPDLPAQMAAELMLAASVQEAPQVVRQLRDMLARRGMLARCAVLEGYDPHATEDGFEVLPVEQPLAWVAMDLAALGNGRPLLVCPASQVPLLAVSAEVPAPVAAARAYAITLAVHCMVERPRIGRHRRRASDVHPLATHRLVDEGRVLRLTRQRFVCA